VLEPTEPSLFVIDSVAATAHLRLSFYLLKLREARVVHETGEKLRFLESLSLFSEGVASLSAMRPWRGVVVAQNGGDDDMHLPE